MIRYILLGMLQYQPMTGYDLKQLIDHSTSHFWHAYHSQIYTTLRGMEKEGLLVSELFAGAGQPDRRVYTLTETGQQALKTWLDQAMTEMSPIKEELLVRIFFSARREKSQIMAELNLQRELHQHKLAEYQAMADGFVERNVQYAPHLAREARFWQATLRLGMRYEAAYLDWLEETIQTVAALDENE